MVPGILRMSALAAGLTLTVGASAAAEGVSFRTEYYGISGKTGGELYASMVSRSPRGGLSSRMIARTFYRQIDWQTKLEPRNGVCRLALAKPRLAVTYTYPKPSESLSPVLKQRWNRFITAIRKHEENHGRIAREMVSVATTSLKGLEMPNDPSCSKTRAEISRRVDAVRRLYEARQVTFDKVEHGDGGNVTSLILALTR